MYKHTFYDEIFRDYALKDSELATETRINAFPRKLKKEANDIYNRLQIIADKPCLDWIDIEFYETGELVQYENKKYIALKDNQNKNPKLKTDFWQEINIRDFTNFYAENYLAKDNQIEYNPELTQHGELSNEFHPVTIKYLNERIRWSLENIKVANADRLDGKDYKWFASKEEFDKLHEDAVLHSEVIDNLTTDNKFNPLSAKQGLELKKLIDRINEILTSDDVSLDELQEIVNFIKKNREKLDTLGINNVIGLPEKLQELTNVSSNAVPKDWWNSDTFRQRVVAVSGDGSDIDADKLDGLHRKDFVTKDEFTKSYITQILGTTPGAGSGLDADKLDGLHSTSFLRRDTNDTPSMDNIFDLGSTTAKWANIYATNFQGTSLRAKYADLAEKYKTDKKYNYGTILGIDEKGIITEYKRTLPSMKLIGVVSENPALKLNSESDGCYVALKGLVPVNVKDITKVNISDYIIADDNGYGISVKDYDFNQSKLVLGIVVEIKDNKVYIKV